MNNSIFNFEIDFEKSLNGYIFDKKTKKKYLDFFGQYSTLTLGYNSKLFNKKKIHTKLSKIFPQKIVNCELETDVYNDFRDIFKKKLGLGVYKYFHFCSTGALAVEAAIKTAITASKFKSNRIIVFKGSFHGINGYGGIFTDRFSPIDERLNNFPGSYISHVDISTMAHGLQNESQLNIRSIIKQLQKKITLEKVSAVLIEPIQSTYGDRYFNKKFFIELEKICIKNHIPLIFDEIQTGFYTTGKKWYLQHLGITPDIVIFGKKTQVSGIMVNDKYSDIFKQELKLNVTWNSDIIDMYRCNLIINFIEKNKLLKKISKFSDEITKFLNNFTEITNTRSCGYLFAFDLKNKIERDNLVNKLFSYGVLVNPTRENSIRLRPNLNTSLQEINFFKKSFTKSINEIKFK